MVHVATVLVPLESFQWTGVNQVGFIVFWPTSKKNVEYWTKFFTENKIKSRLKFIGELGDTLGIIGKPSLSRILWRQFGKF